jgi:hypothetical protein
MQLAKLGARAEEVAAGFHLLEGVGFQNARQLIRDALSADGVAAEIEALVGDAGAFASDPDQPEAAWRRVGEFDPRSGAWVDGPHWHQPQRPWWVGL